MRPSPPRSLRRFVAPAPFLASVAACAFAWPSLAAAAPSPAAHAAIRVETREGDAHPWLLAGPLVAASNRGVDVVARDALATHAPWASSLEVEPVETLDVADGARVVVFAQRMGGVPVIGAGARVMVDSDGRATMMTSALVDARLASTTPRTTATEAERIARDVAGPLVAAMAAESKLLVWAGAGAPRLVWGVASHAEGLPFRPVTLVDAETGDVLLQYDATVSMGLARVYDQNPVKTPKLIETKLANDPKKPGLQNELVSAKNCVDKKTTRDVSFGITVKIHACELLPTVKPDASGDYTDIAPGAGLDAEPLYGELSMFHHTHKAYEFARDLGFPTARQKQIFAVANLRLPAGIFNLDLKKMSDPSLPLVAFDNAFYAPKDPLFSSAFGLEDDAMWFGKGTRANFGYDGDVVYHEFGHFVVNQTVKLVPYAHADEFGLSYSPGSMNEGFADVFSCFITGDPYVGEYAAKGLGLGEGIRQLTSPNALPDTITGEVHFDSLPFSAAIWKVYAPLAAAKRPAFHKATLKALMSAPTGNLGYGDLAALITAAVSEGVDAATGDALAASFGERGVKTGNPRVRTYAKGSIQSADARLGVKSPGKRSVGSKGNVAPGLMQIRYDAPVGQTKLHVAFDLGRGGAAFGAASALFGGGGKFEPAVLVKTGGEPIRFTYAPTAHDATTTAPCTIAEDKSSASCDAELDVPGEPGKMAPLHVMIGNTGDGDGNYDNVSLSAKGPPTGPKAAPDAGAAPTSDAGVEGPKAVPESESKGGCGCAVPGAAERVGGGAIELVIAGIGAALARRRRH